MEVYVIQRIYCRVVVACFLLLLFTPLVVMSVTKTQMYSRVEKRLLAEFPKPITHFQQMQQFFRDVDTYLNDHFGLRELFVHRYHRAVQKRFGETGADAVYRGLDNWYYYGKSKMLWDFAGKKRLSPQVLDYWQQEYREKIRWLGENGIEYLLIAAPNKESVYPEYVIKSWQKMRGQTRLEQLAEAFFEPQDHAHALLQLAPHLRAQRGKELLYFKSDTHWTDYGAFLAYLEIAERLKRLLPGSTFKKDFHFSPPQTRECRPDNDQCGDLTNMLLDFPPFFESIRVLDNSTIHASEQPLIYQLSHISKNPEAPSTVARCSQEGPRALIFHDSFFLSLKPFISENFREVVYLRKRYDQNNITELIRYFHPDIVIEELVERDFFVE